VNFNVPSPQVPPDHLFGRPFQDFGKSVIGWGTGADGANARVRSVTLGELQSAGVTLAQVEAIRDFYAAVLARNPANKAAAARVGLANRILELLAGD
jgi:hypothetical protein